jgi:hypothetical protein
VAAAILAFASSATSAGTPTSISETPVLVADPVEGNVQMESFFFAETLKYLYVLLGPPNTINLKTTVLNTEAHPLRRTW